ncbi:MAG: nucleotide disphospho-sugar-binding domain-containing protein [Acidobacteriota bacterium]
MRFLFCSLSNDGFLFSAVAVARALQDLGHEVAFVTDITRAAVLEEAGLRRIPRGRKDGGSFEIATWFYNVPIAIQVKHIEYALEVFPADVLVGQPLAIGPVVVRDRIGIPLVVLGMGSPVWPTDPELVVREPTGATEQRRLGRYQQMMEVYNKARKLFQLPPVDEDFVHSSLLGDLYLAQSVPELWAPRGGMADRMELIGACLWEPPQSHRDVDDWLALEPSKPLIYLQIGRSFLQSNPAQMLFSCLDPEEVRAAASVGRCDSQPDELSDHFLVRDFVPQERVLPQADAVVCTGNSTVMLGALTHGVPMLILYGKGEQPDVAEVCVEAGAAIALPVAEVTGSDIRQGLNRLRTEQQFRQRARELQQAFAGYGGPQAAAQHIVGVAAENGVSAGSTRRVATAP